NILTYSFQSKDPFLNSYIKPSTITAKKIPIFQNPSNPNSLKFTAHGYINTTSMSKTTNKMATMKYLTEKGCLALPMTSIPDSNAPNLVSVRIFGPIKCVAMMVPTPKATAKAI